MFLSRLKEKSIPNLSKLPIDEDLCKRGLQCAFEKVVESGFHHYIRNEQQSKQLEAVANWLVSPEKKWGLLLNGIPGNGKTTTLMAIRKVINALELEDPNPISENKVLGFRCQTAKELCEIAIKTKQHSSNTRTPLYLVSMSSAWSLLLFLHTAMNTLLFPTFWLIDTRHVCQL